MSHQKGDVIESVQDVGPYVVIAINEGGDMSTFTHARQDCLAMMLMEFFDKHPDIYDTMWQMKVAAQRSASHQLTVTPRMRRRK